MTKEFTYISDGYVELADQAEARFQQGMLYIRQDAPFMEGPERLRLSPEAQWKLLEALYQRRYALYMGTHLCLGDSVPDWIASGRSGNVTIITDADQEKQSDL